MIELWLVVFVMNRAHFSEKVYVCIKIKGMYASAVYFMYVKNDK